MSKVQTYNNMKLLRERPITGTCKYILGRVCDFLGRVAHQNVLARPVGLVSCRRSHHPPHTSASPTAHFDASLLTHCSGTAPSCSLVFLFLWLLVHPAGSTLSTLDGEPQQDGGRPELAPRGCKTGCRAYAMPSPRRFLQNLACCPRSFCFFLPTCLPRSGCFASHPAIRLVYSNPGIALRNLHSLSLCLYLSHSPVSVDPLATPMPKKKSPEDFFRRAREKGSEINKEIVNSTEVQKHLEDKTVKNYARALDLWNG